MRLMVASRYLSLVVSDAMSFWSLRVILLQPECMHWACDAVDFKVSSLHDNYVSNI
jgi:hypothetical protein